MLPSRGAAIIASILLLASTATRAQGPAWIEAYRTPVDRIISAATANDFAWQRLAYLTDTFGNRLSGSQSLEDAIKWAAAEMEKDGLENVRMDPVKVPHWVRGTESLELLSPRHQSVPVLGLGLSIGTPAEGIEADLLVVESFVELERRAVEARGKIVLFNAPFKGYGPTVAYRVNGPSQAAGAGALAVLVRSIGLDGLRTTHTGMLTYREGVPRIPAAAITAEDAARLARMAARGEKLRVRLRMGAEMLPDADSANVIAEVQGREKPEEVVILGAHLDSWDLGRGALDNGCNAALVIDAGRQAAALARA
ncbi:MAG TPA: M28 family peptidase, partial [Vicinamibacterales bacterium]|nr:M28 family peptidase [Vicinamibacterales bacterium]